MGTDINGVVECRPTSGLLDARHVRWGAAVDLRFLLDQRDYDAFGCLFGVRNHAGFRPLAAGRGLPDDVSAETRRIREERVSGAHDTTWIGWPELARVDWDEPAAEVDGRVHEYAPAPDGGWTRVGKRLRPGHGRPEGDAWTEHGRLFRVARLTRRDAVPEDGDWAPVWTVMRTLAELHGGENVRLVVWFDS
ncbi:hypothetical protein JCM4814A_77140 [Streptomyces phaeofaciens JCM 4814]|uniref:Uncharacterized protein n=1 Tax=Streptomyces phaeofaciens TaxID=68254 RepID=A0A918HNA4_9ACTN|nr:hypothetical protein [Streptomyces phaeofaciens]GGT85981.1 hypothetical protein GCM10010226_75770 [Streptomyces phaeofaciens]